MKEAVVPIIKRESLWDEMEKVRDRVMRRAHDLFLANGGRLGRDLEDWFEAENELLWKPAIELREKDEEFRLKIAVPGVEAKDLDIEVTAEDLLVKAETRREEKKDTGDVHTSELRAGNLFRAVHFPKKVDPERVKADLKNGILLITAPIVAEARATKVKVEGAA
jgi:HSP20 family protein